MSGNTDRKKNIGVIKFLDNSITVITMTMLAIMLTLIAYQVIARYILKTGSAIIDETVRYLYIWFIYFGMVLATKERQHVSITMLVDKFKGKYKVTINILSNIFWLYFNLYVVIVSIKLINEMAPIKARTAAWHVLEITLYTVLPICFTWTSIYILRDIIINTRQLFKREEIIK